ncbi:MAG: nucleotide exchange factor GrpE [Bacteroidota bacterium]|nr:nucleotide exchange factor GrpE [Bacteroidota bacterium]
MTKKSINSLKKAKGRTPAPRKINNTLKELKEKIKNEEEKYLRLFAEFENYKKRTTKERIELYKTAGKEIMLSLIPVLEDFKRALNQDLSKTDDSQGITLIYNKLSDSLKSQGLNEIETNIGDEFDPDRHEAISQIPAEKKENKGKIIDVIEGGYSLGDQIIKFPKVVVAQ